MRRNLERVHPTRDGAWLDAAVGRVFRNFALCFADLLSLNREPVTGILRHVAIQGEEHARGAIARGRGCVFVTAHIGNWELAGRLLAALGARVHVVMAPEQDPAVAALLHDAGSDGVRLVRRESPLISIELVAALRRREVVAFQMDRAAGERADCRIPFFKTPAPFPLGPFLLAAAVGAPVVPAFCVLDGRGNYRLSVEPPIEVGRGREIEGLRWAVSVLERYVAGHSDQWFNFFDVWDEPAGA